MKPTGFEESNVRLLKPESMTDEECGSLDVYTDGEQCISCWEMSGIPFCNYLSITGERRGCPVQGCTKYKRKPQRKKQEVENG